MRTDVAPVRREACARVERSRSHGSGVARADAVAGRRYLLAIRERARRLVMRRANRYLVVGRRIRRAPGEENENHRKLERVDSDAAV